MLLAIDIGNTNVVLGIIQGDSILNQWRLTTSHTRTRDEFWVTVKLLAMDADIDVKQISDVIIASVVPPLADQFVLMSRKYLLIDPVIVRHTLDIGVKYLVDNPAELGADRICDIAGAVNRFPLPQIIVDMGTATTFDIVDENRNYLGGSIMPGIETAGRSLIASAAKLPKVNFLPIDTVIGKNTVQHLHAGFFWGGIDQIDGMIRRIKKETGWISPSVIATGGLSKVLAKHSTEIGIVDHDLTLSGLNMIFHAARRKE